MYWAESMVPFAIVRLLVPHLLICGSFARRVQQAIHQQKDRVIEQKSGNSSASALTDADIAIQDYMGMVVSHFFPSAIFYGEEYDRDRVSHYLPKAGSVTIAVDPIDGTRRFRTGVPAYDIVVTVIRDNRLIASIDYRPGLPGGPMYIAVVDEGLFFTNHDMIRDNAAWRQIRISPPTGIPRILVGTCSDAIREKIQAHGFVVIDSRDREKSLPAHCIISGEIDGIYQEKSNVIDWVSYGFAAECGGGAMNIVTVGKPDDDGWKVPRLIAARTPEIYQQLKNCVSS